MSRRVLVVGGSGQTGRQIVHQLPAAGFAARVLARDTERARQALGPGVELFSGDITRPDSVAAAMAQADAVVIVVESSTSDQAPNSPQQVHYQGARHVLAAAAGREVQVVLVSQIYITRPERYPEVRNIIRWRGEAEAALRASGQPYTIVRPSWLTDQAGGRQALRLEQGDTGEGQVSRADVAKVCVQALLHPAARGKTFEVYGVPGAPPRAWGALFAALQPDGLPG